MIDIVRLYTDNNVDFATEHKHVQKGWVGTPCPFCSGNTGYHLGYCTDPSSKFAGKFTCWRCGGKNKVDALSRILSLSKKQAYRTHLAYLLTNPKALPSNEKHKPHKILTDCVFPTGTKNMTSRHKSYLEKREFDVVKLKPLWNLKGTGPVGPYKHRIIAPIYFKGILVSYQGRDITGHSEMKYKACAEINEIRSHKHCLYGLDLVKGDSVVVVEGITDAWRLGAGAVATFGIKYKQAQVLLLSRFKNIFIAYDSEAEDPEAGYQASKMADALTAPSKNVEIIELAEGDPGSLVQKDADYLMKKLLG